MEPIFVQIGDDLIVNILNIYSIQHKVDIELSTEYCDAESKLNNLITEEYNEAIAEQPTLDFNGTTVTSKDDNYYTALMEYVKFNHKNDKLPNKDIYVDKYTIVLATGTVVSVNKDMYDNINKELHKFIINK